jgi:hypothetical protein
VHPHSAHLCRPSASLAAGGNEDSKGRARGDDTPPSADSHKGGNKGSREWSGQQQRPIRAWIGPMWAELVPHTGCPAIRTMRANLTRLTRCGQVGSMVRFHKGADKGAGAQQRAALAAHPPGRTTVRGGPCQREMRSKVELSAPHPLPTQPRNGQLAQRGITGS